MTNYNFNKFWSSDIFYNRFKNTNKIFENQKLLIDKIRFLENFKILDIGCGNATFLQHLIKNKISFKKYVGLDINKKLLDEAVRKFSFKKSLINKTNFISIDFMDKSFKDKFEVTNSIGVLQHNPKYINVINKILSVSKKYAIFDLKTHFEEEKLDFLNIRKSYSGHVMNRLHYISIHINELYNIFSKYKDFDFYSYAYPIKNNKNTKTFNIRLFSVCVLAIKKSNRSNNMISLNFI